MDEIQRKSKNICRVANVILLLLSILPLYCRQTKFRGIHANYEFVQSGLSILREQALQRDMQVAFWKMTTCQVFVSSCPWVISSSHL